LARAARDKVVVASVMQPTHEFYRGDNDSDAGGSSREVPKFALGMRLSREIYFATNVRITLERAVV